MEGERFRHTAQFVALARRTGTRESCTYDQLEEPVNFDLAEVLAQPGSRGNPPVRRRDRWPGPNTGRRRRPGLGRKRGSGRAG